MRSKLSLLVNILWNGAARLVVPLLLIYCVWSGFAEESSWDIFTYSVESNQVTITGMSEFLVRGDLIIPAEINGMPVRHVGDKAFEHLDVIESLVIPDTVTSVGDYAFPSTDFTNLFVGSNLTHIGMSAFLVNRFLYIDVDDDNPAYSSVDGVLFDQTQNRLVMYPSGREGGYAIPPSVTTVGDAAFKSSGLTSLVIPASVLDIGNSAFEMCGVTNVVIGSSVTNVGNNAFSMCKYLKNILFPISVVRIGDGVLSDCSLLETVVLNNSLEQIGDDAFYGCNMLAEITLPASLTTLGRGAFVLCTGLTNISVHASNSFFTSIDGVLLNAGMTELIQYPPSKEGNAYTFPAGVTHLGYAAMSMASNLSSIVMSSNLVSIGTGGLAGCSGLQSITIPDSVTTLGDSVFFECINLTSVVIGESVSAIGDYAFWKCTGLTGAYFRGDAPTLGTNAFLDATPTVYYLEGASGFGETFGGRPTAVWTP